MPADTRKASLAPRYLLIALGPPIVLLINQCLLQKFGIPFDVPPAKAAAFDVHSEAVARYGMLAALLLFIGAALAALGFFFYTLRMLEWKARARTLIVFVVLALAAVFIPATMGELDGFDYSGRSLACYAAGHAPTEPGSSAAQAERAATALAIPRLSKAQPCGNARFDDLNRLGRAQYFGVTFSFSALVLGAICCLAPAPGSDPPRSVKEREAEPGKADAEPVGNAELEHWEEQSQWLNNYLYLAALLLITALIFIHAYLRWPGFVLEARSGYDSHMAALVSYYGFTFTVMLAAFYIPVAMILSRRVKPRKETAAGESKLPSAFAGSFQLLKIVLALFSSAFAGALPDILDTIV